MARRKLHFRVARVVARNARRMKVWTRRHVGTILVARETLSRPPEYPAVPMKRFVAAAGIVVLALAPRPACAQEPREDRRPPAQIQDSIRIAEFARELVADAPNDSVRAATLYAWIARTLAYDAQGYLTGRTGAMDPETVWNRRTAVCQGYVELFQRMAMEIGLRTEAVSGYAKGFDYEPGQRIRDANHAWIAIWLGGRWQLMDPTWGSGIVVHGQFQPQFSWAYFLTPPEVLQLSHSPDDSQWQLVERPLSRREFERMPAVSRLLVDAGFAPSQLRSVALLADAPGFPLVGSIAGGVRVVRAPAQGVLPENAPVTFEIVWPGAQDVAVVSDGVWTRLEEQDQVFSGGTVAGGEVVQLVGKLDGRTDYQTLLHYTVR